MAIWEDGDLRPQRDSAYSLAKRITMSGLIERLHDLGYNAVMFPLQACVADMQIYDWKFAYLITAFGALDSQLGDWHEIKEMVDEFHRQKLIVIPDLILVHCPENTSPRSVDQIGNQETGRLWFDSQPHKHCDYGTLMFNLEDEQIRAQLIESIVRFVKELKLYAFRLDFVDGLVHQYGKREGENFGERFLTELHERLDEESPTTLCITEAFDSRNRKPVQAFAHLLYQPWVGFKTMDLMLQDGMIPWSPWMARSMSRAINEANGQQEETEEMDADGQPQTRPQKPTVAYALSHDECGCDRVLLKNRKQDTGTNNSAGGHIAQLVLQCAEQLVKTRRLAEADVLDFVARRVAMIEAITMFSADFAYMTVGGFSDFLKLGCYNNVKTGWQTLWTTGHHADLMRWRKITGLSGKAVRERIDAHAGLMRSLRDLYLNTTTIDLSSCHPEIHTRCAVASEKQPVLAIIRDGGERPEDTLMLAFNFGMETMEGFRVPLDGDYPGTWQVVNRMPAVEPAEESRMPEITGVTGPSEIELRLPPNSFIILRHATFGRGPHHV